MSAHSPWPEPIVETKLWKESRYLPSQFVRLWAREIFFSMVVWSQHGEEDLSSPQSLKFLFQIREFFRHIHIGPLIGVIGSTHLTWIFAFYNSAPTISYALSLTIAGAAWKIWPLGNILWEVKYWLISFLCCRWKTMQLWHSPWKMMVIMLHPTLTLKLLWLS